MLLQTQPNLTFFLHDQKTTLRKENLKLGGTNEKLNFALKGIGQHQGKGKLYFLLNGTTR